MMFAALARKITQLIPFVQAGMNKSGQWNATTAWSKITGWAADAAYPGGSIVNDELVVSTHGINRQVQIGLTFTPSASSNTTAQVRLYQNNAIINTGTQVSVPAFSSGNAFATATGVNHSPGDRFWAEGISSGSFPARTTTGYLRDT